MIDLEDQVPVAYPEELERYISDAVIESNALIESVIESLADQAQALAIGADVDADQVASRLSGEIRVLTDQAETTANKILDRIQGEADQQAADAVGQLLAAGAVGPTDTVQAGEIAQLPPSQAAIDYFYVPQGRIPPEMASYYLAPPAAPPGPGGPPEGQGQAQGQAQAALDDQNILASLEGQGWACATGWRPVSQYTSFEDMSARLYNPVGFDDSTAVPPGAIKDESGYPGFETIYWCPPCTQVEQPSKPVEPVKECCEPPANAVIMVPWTGCETTPGPGPGPAPTEPTEPTEPEEESPIPAPPAAPPAGQAGSGLRFDWATNTPCDEPDWQTLQQDKVQADFENSIKLVLNKVLPEIQSRLPSEFQGTVAEIFGWLLNSGQLAGVGLTVGLQKALVGLVEVLTLGNTRNPGTTTGAFMLQLLPGILGKWVGGPWEYLYQSALYLLQWSDPQLLPSQPEIDQQYQTGIIDRKVWECLTKSLGNIPERRLEMVENSTAKPSIGEQIILELRGEQDKAQTDKELASLGVMRSADKAKFRKLAEQYPTIGDIIRFMVRDSFDIGTVQKYGYDADFDVKFGNSPEAQRLAKAAGVPVEIVKLFWYAHWEIPSPTQLFEMLHRLRPGKNLGGVQPVTKQDVIDALKVNDMAPGWVDRLAAVSYATITRTDLMQWYTDGTIERPELIERLQDTGYTQDDATRIVDAWELAVKIRRKNRAHTLTINTIVKYYIDGLIDQGEATTLLAAVFPDPDEVNNILAEADLMRLADSRKKCIKMYRVRFMKGEFTAAQAKTQLVTLGMDGGQAGPIVDGWDCELRSASKQIPLAKIRQLLLKGLITVDEVRVRLANLHYTGPDIVRLVNEMVLTRAENLARARAAAQKAAQAAQDKAQKAQKARDKAKADQAKADQQAAEQAQSKAEQAQKAIDRQAAKAQADQAKAAEAQAKQKPGGRKFSQAALAKAAQALESERQKMLESTESPSTSTSSGEAQPSESTGSDGEIDLNSILESTDENGEDSGD